jgi:hypothetical protein
MASQKVMADPAGRNTSVLNINPMYSWLYVMKVVYAVINTYIPVMLTARLAPRTSRILCAFFFTFTV